LHIDVIFSASEVNPSRINGKTVVVIDVLRATSVMVTALNNGAKKVVPVLSPDEGFDYRNQTTEKVVLAGERNSDKIDGFDYGNSPLDMRPENIKGCTLVMTTSNGTRAIRNSSTAAELFVTSFLNAEATVCALNGYMDIVLVCSGSNGVFTMEDTLCAGYLIELLLDQNDAVDLADAAMASSQLYLLARNNIHLLAAQGRHYALLKSKGLTADLEYCFLPNQIDMVCKRRKNSIYAEKNSIPD